MKTCYVVETPFQMFNTLNFVMNNPRKATDEKTLFIGKKFKTAQNYYETAQKLGLFEHVYLYDYERLKSHPVLQRVNVAAPAAYLKAALGVKSPQIHGYDEIYSSSLFEFVQSLKLVNREAKICFLDDGVGSYAGRIGLECFSEKKKALLKFLHLPVSLFFPEQLYVNNLESCKSEWEAEKHSLPSVNGNLRFIEYCDAVFGKPYPEYENIKLIYLSTPNENRDAHLYQVFQEKYDAVVDDLNTHTPAYIYRPHPRDKRTHEDIRYYDDSNCLWELIAYRYIDDSSILIGNISSAQAMPRFLFHKEPYLIFLYNYFNDTDRVPELAETIRQSYTNKDKIFIVKSLDEMNEILNKIQSHSI